MSSSLRAIGSSKQQRSLGKIRGQTIDQRKQRVANRLDEVFTAQRVAGGSDHDGIVDEEGFPAFSLREKVADHRASEGRPSLDGL